MTEAQLLQWRAIERHLNTLNAINKQRRETLRFHLSLMLYTVKTVYHTHQRS